MSFRTAITCTRGISRSIPSSGSRLPLLAFTPVGPLRLPSRSFASSSRYLAQAVASGPTAASVAGTAAAGAGAGAGAGPSSSNGYKKGRNWGLKLGLVLAIPVAFMVGALFPPQLVLIFNPRYSPPPPSADSKHGQLLMEETEREMQELFLVHKMRAKKDWYETRPYQRFDPNKIHNSLTAGSLKGPGMLAVAPVAFVKQDESQATIVLHVGRALCGHDGIIHGGLLATVFDESLARNALMNLPSHIGVTANLNINYRSPCMADQFIVVRTKLESKQGRKVYVSGTMETLDGERIAEATALFVEPKWAQFLQSSGVTEALGVPSKKASDEHQV